MQVAHMSQVCVFVCVSKKQVMVGVSQLGVVGFKLHLDLGANISLGALSTLLMPMYWVNVPMLL